MALAHQRVMILCNQISTNFHFRSASLRNCGMTNIPMRLDLYPGWRTWNPSITKFGDRLLISYNWQPTESNRRRPSVRIAELDNSLKIIRDLRIDLSSSRVCADMRLFVHKGVLFGAYFEGSLHEDLSGLVLVQLSADFKITDRIELAYGQRRRYEKNWQFFSRNEDLLCIYRICPHVVLKLKGERLEQTACTSWNSRFKGPLLGGTPPIEFDNEYISFFHSWKPWLLRGLRSWRFVIHPALSVLNNLIGWPFKGAGTWPHRVYSFGAYTFATSSPFSIRKITTKPLMIAPTNDAHPRFPACVFPCGSCWHNGVILLSYGYHDKECRVAAYAPEALRQCLSPVSAQFVPEDRVRSAGD
jgi:hypothetical protein